MQFIDRTLFRLADATESSEVFTPEVGSRVLAAGFVFNNVEVGEATGVTVRDVELMPAAARLQRFEGSFFHPTTGSRWDGTGSMLVTGTTSAAHARLELRITTETRIADTSVERIDFEAVNDLADVAVVDARIVADDGALPATATALGIRRFEALKKLLFERFTQPADVDIDQFIAKRGITTFDELIGAFQPPNHVARLELEMVVNGTLPPGIETHRVIAAAVIDDDPFAHVIDLVERIQLGRAALELASETAAPPQGMNARFGLPFVVIFPESVLDDGDLPMPSGANPGDDAQRRALRLSELQDRLVTFGIALAPIA